MKSIRYQNKQDKDTANIKKYKDVFGVSASFKDQNYTNKNYLIGITILINIIENTIP